MATIQEAVQAVESVTPVLLECDRVLRKQESDLAVLRERLTQSMAREEELKRENQALRDEVKAGQTAAADAGKEHGKKVRELEKQIRDLETRVATMRDHPEVKRREAERLDLQIAELQAAKQKLGVKDAPVPPSVPDIEE